MDETVQEASSAEIVCQLCSKVPSRYTCPRCNIRYCHSDCYKSEAHVRCSEAFYRDCFMDGLHSMETSGEEKRKMMDMLRRLEEDDATAASNESEDEEEVDLAERISGIDMERNPEKLWERLTSREKTEFLEMVRANRSGDVIPLWEPWWLSKKSLVEEINPSNAGQPKSLTCPSKILTGVPDIDDLLKKSSPSDVVKYGVVNVLYGYVYAARLYNGDQLEMAVESADVLCSVAAGLTGRQFSSSSDAIGDCLTNLAGPAKAYFVARDYSVAVAEDVCKILSASPPLGYTLAALSDCHAVLKRAKKELDSEVKSPSSNHDNVREVQEQRKVYFNAQKKLEFLVSWAKKYGAVLVELVPEVELEICSLSMDLATHEGSKEKVEQVMDKLKREKSKILIEELDSKSDSFK